MSLSPEITMALSVDEKIRLDVPLSSDELFEITEEYRESVEQIQHDLDAECEAHREVKSDFEQMKSTISEILRKVNLLTDSKSYKVWESRHQELIEQIEFTLL